MPDDDSLLGQNEVDVRNEARKPITIGWLHQENDRLQRDDDLAQAVDHLRRLNETPSLNEDAEQRRQESITRTLDEIQRLMDG